MHPPTKPHSSSNLSESPPDDSIDAIFAMCSPEQNESVWGDDFEKLHDASNRPWVLSIEDDDDFAAMLQIKLNEEGLRVLRASAGMEGYRRAFFDAPKAILLDYELPMGQGDYVLGRLKESPVTSNIPVIVLTGRHETPIERKMRMLGAAEFLTKPLQWGRLKSALADMVLA